MAISLSEVTKAISEQGASWEAGETEVSRYASLPVDEVGCFGLSISDEQARVIIGRSSDSADAYVSCHRAATTGH